MISAAEAREMLTQGQRDRVLQDIERDIQEALRHNRNVTGISWRGNDASNETALSIIDQLKEEGYRLEHYLHEEGTLVTEDPQDNPELIQEIYTEIWW
jgi:succinyl-CoA synthetase alpha subunit